MSVYGKCGELKIPLAQLFSVENKLTESECVLRSCELNTEWSYGFLQKWVKAVFPLCLQPLRGRIGHLALHYTRRFMSILACLHHKKIKALSATVLSLGRTVALKIDGHVLG